MKMNKFMNIFLLASLVAFANVNAKKVVKEQSSQERIENLQDEVEILLNQLQVEFPEILEYIEKQVEVLEVDIPELIEKDELWYEITTSPKVFIPVVKQIIQKSMIIFCLQQEIGYEKIPNIIVVNETPHWYEVAVERGPAYDDFSRKTKRLPWFKKLCFFAKKNK